MGRSCACKFLFGDETTVDEKEKIESALENKEELKTELYFYRKDGEFDISFNIATVFDRGHLGGHAYFIVTLQVALNLIN